ncbi:NADP-dependent malic enzyme [Aestuariispira insulae]|uniref:Allosteric NADP-dependent malic enzyme n=1 Tax=Aestuariispira insulae TaxID=1461337 RepID=A0A3D9HE21_9PROT|nr:NADP-dependent malic enzyme [Aestuariispira insulae]RED47722.1 allosteric NADP-dependent malic enzyme [Aestuariispira insulae]
MPDKRMTEEDALLFHAQGRPGKLEIAPTKPLTTQRDLSLAYSPGVAVPCLRIADDPAAAYDYTARGNTVAVISNGTAVLGLGAIGALASKPVMEGKAVLFKRFADVDGIDLEVDTTDVDEFVNCVRFLGKSFGGINLEDIKAPECFIIEQRLRELMDIPVFHDDQHGTAIIAAAGLLNALYLTGRDIKDCKLVVNGAGAAAIACVELVKALGVQHDNVVMCDSKGVIYQGRSEGMNQWKSAHAVKTKDRTLEEAMKGADAFFGLSVKGAVTPKMVEEMAEKPIIFAMANPDPEITPDEVKSVRKDAIVATGRSDFANQVNNVLGFPYIFRGALDVRASTINDEMKMAAAQAIASLAREDVPDEVAAAYGGMKLVFGPEYIIPAPFDPRLIVAVPAAVAKAAMDSGVAHKPIIDMEAYKQELQERLDPTASMLNLIFEKVRSNPRRVAFAEGEEERVIRAAIAFRNAGYGKPVLIGREDRIKQTMDQLGLAEAGGDLEIFNARLSHRNNRYADFLYNRMARKGLMYRDCQRLVKLDRNVFASCMLALGDTDAVVSGTTRTFSDTFEGISRVIDPRAGEQVMGLLIVVARGRTIFVADTSIHELPDSETLADIAEQTADFARSLGHEPRVAFMSASSFGNPVRAKADRIAEAVKVLDGRKVDFEYDGEMSPSVALNHDHMKRLYPFCRLSHSANVLVMPGLHTAHVSTRLLQELGGGTVMGPLLMGLAKPVQIVQTGASVNDLVNAAALAVHDALR